MKPSIFQVINELLTVIFFVNVTAYLCVRGKAHKKGGLVSLGMELGLIRDLPFRAQSMQREELYFYVKTKINVRSLGVKRNASKDRNNVLCLLYALYPLAFKRKIPFLNPAIF